MKLKSKLMLLFSLTVIIATIPIVTLGLYQAQKQSRENVDAQFTGLLSSAANEMDGWLNQNAKVVETLGFSIQTSIPPESLNKSYFSIMHMGNNKENLSDLYYGRESDGAFLNGADWTPDGDYDPRKRPWYIEARDTGKLVYSAPYQDAMTGQYAVSIAMPLNDANGNSLGVVAGDILLKKLTDVVNDIDSNGLGFSFLLDGNGNILAHPDETIVNTPVSENSDLGPLLADMKAHEKGQNNLSYQGENSLLFYNQVPSTGWIVGTVLSEKQAYSELYKLRTQFVLIIAVTLVVVVAASYIVARGFTSPLIRLKRISQGMSSGDFTQRITVKGRDEFAELGTAFNGMSVQLGSLLGQVSASAGQVQAISSELNEHTMNTRRIAEQITLASDELAIGSSTQAESVNDGSVRLTEMSEAVSGINRNVEFSVSMMGEASDAMNDGIKMVQSQIGLAGENRSAIHDINKSLIGMRQHTKRIEDVAGIIYGLSSQTNILALNAAIEAARAGEAGRGFAVVAGEVRKLAEHSSSAVVEIMELLRDIKQSSDQSLKVVNSAEDAAEQQIRAGQDTESSFERIRVAIGGMGQQIQAVSHATKELEANAGKISDVIAEVASMSQQSAASTEEVASSTQEQFNYIKSISERSAELAEHAEHLSREVSRFKV